MLKTSINLDSFLASLRKTYREKYNQSVVAEVVTEDDPTMDECYFKFHDSELSGKYPTYVHADPLSITYYLIMMIDYQPNELDWRHDMNDILNEFKANCSFLGRPAKKVYVGDYGKEIEV